MVTASEIRDLWEADLREEAERLDEPERQPWEELAYMRWHLLRTDIPVIRPDPERTWLWSDLHLGDDTFALLKRRPFPTTEDMDRELLASWRATVRPDDLIICLGDVAVASFWTDPEHVNDVKSCPGHFLFDVTLTRASRRTVKVDFETIAGGTATEGDDYHARRTYTHVILAGDRSAQMGFALIEATVDDAGETVKARLSNARVVDAYGETVRDLDITRAEATGTITAPPSTSDVSNLSIRIDDTTGNEDDSFLRFNVRLSQKYTDYVCYDFETISGGTATEGVDYDRRPKVGHWVDIGDRTDDPFVYIIDDRVNDDGETVGVKISNVRLCGDASKTVSITRAQATGTIRNTDPVNGDRDGSEESVGTAVTPVPALPAAGIGLLGLVLALLGSRRRLNDRRQLHASRGR